MRFLGSFTAVLALSTASFTLSSAYAQTPTPQMQPLQNQPASAPQPAPVYYPASSAPQASPAPKASPAPQTVAADSVGSGAIPSLPLEVQTSNSISFINGGISDEEVAELKAKANEFNLHVLLSAKNGEYISDITLVVLDHKGTPVVSVEDAGPYFYAQLQPGAYSLETTSATGEKKKAKLTIGKGVVKQHVVYNE